MNWLDAYSKAHVEKYNLSYLEEVNKPYCSACTNTYPLYQARGDIVIKDKIFECCICKVLKCGYCNDGWIPHCSRRALRLYFCSKACDDQYEEMD